MDHGKIKRSVRDIEQSSGDSAAPTIGCAGCLVIVGIVAVDYFPYVSLQAPLASGRHPLWADTLIAFLGLAAGPIVASLVGYFGFRWRDRLIAAVESRWRGLTSLENAAALNLDEATFVLVVALGLGTGALLGTGVVRALDAFLP